MAVALQKPQLDSLKFLKEHPISQILLYLPNCTIVRKRILCHSKLKNIRRWFSWNWKRGCAI